MRVKICFHHTQGLENDAKVIGRTLYNQEVEFDYVCYREESLYEMYTKKEKCTHDIVIFLEHIHPKYIEVGEKVIYILNPECVTKRDQLMLKHCHQILCKTRMTYEVMKDYNREYIGFSSVDRYLGDIKKQPQCIHIRGVSKYKQTQVVIDTWLANPQYPIIHIVTQESVRIPNMVKIAENVILHQRKLEEEELKELMNICELHVCPSMCEGYGHYINEARSVGGIVLTTDAAPMNEHITKEYGILIKYENKIEKNGVCMYEVTQPSLEKGVEKYMRLSSEERCNMMQKAREMYIESTLDFERRFQRTLSSSSSESRSFSS